MTLSIYSEIVGPNGGLAGHGASRLLGQPPLSPIGLVIREAVQNSWDARIAEDRGIKFSIELRRVDTYLKTFLVDDVFPRASEVKIPVANALRDNPWILVLTDSNTVGLEGPVRANAVVDGEPRRFADFFRNIGATKITSGRGGTYGFGKTSLYRLSEASSIAVFSRARPSRNAKYEERFMAAAMGADVIRGKNRLSGRHWWGKTRMTDSFADPVTGDVARKYAERLGLLVPGQSGGTSIGVLAPRIRFTPQISEEITDSILYNFWPKMLADAAGEPGISFSVKIEGKVVPVPEPDAHPRIKPFVDCYRALERGNRTATLVPIKGSSDASSNILGKLVHMRVPHPESGALRRKAWEPLPARTHHICLMRKPELVVRYLPGPTSAGLPTGYAAVFRANDKYDEVFASAEPPAHDDWITQSLPPTNKAIVSHTLRRVKSIVRDAFGARQTTSSHPAVDTPLGSISAFLGELLDGVEGDGSAVLPIGEGTTGTRMGGRTSRQTKASIKKVSSYPIAVEDGDIVTMQTLLELVVPAAIGSATIVAEAGILTAEGREAEAPKGAAGIRITAWKDEAGAIVSRSARLEVEGVAGTQRYVLQYKMPRRAAGAVTFRINESGNA